MRQTLSILSLVLMTFFTSCNPDEEDTNSGNGGNGGNGGGNNTGNAASYPEIVNLLEGSWYGVSIEYVNINGSVTQIDTEGTQNIGYITFDSNTTGELDLSTWLGIDEEFTENNICSKYPVSVDIIDGSWAGSGPELIVGYFLQSNVAGDEDSYVPIKYTTPFYNVNTSTIMYGIGFHYATLLASTESLNRIHTLTDDTLILVWPLDQNFYGKMTLAKV